MSKQYTATRISTALTLLTTTGQGLQTKLKNESMKLMPLLKHPLVERLPLGMKRKNFGKDIKS